jgi:hypothetical protein
MHNWTMQEHNGLVRGEADEELLFEDNPENVEVPLEYGDYRDLLVNPDSTLCN